MLRLSLLFCARSPLSYFFFFFLILRQPQRSTPLYSSAASDVYKRQQLEVVCSLLVERYHVNINVKEPTVIYLERPLKTASYTIHIEVPPNPFWASIGLTVTPLPAGSGTRFKSKVSLGYLNQSFQNAVMEGVRYGMEQGLYGWEVTDCEICFDYGVYYSPVSTLSLIHISEPTRQAEISYAVFCLKKKKNKKQKQTYMIKK